MVQRLALALSVKRLLTNPAGVCYYFVCHSAQVALSTWFLFMRKEKFFSLSKLLLGFGLGLTIVLAFFLIKNLKNSKTYQFKPATKEVFLNRKWEFSALDRNGLSLEKQKITFSLVSVQKTNQIYVKNKPVRTTPENAFLVLSLELKNDTDKRVYFYSSDLVRLLTKDEKKFEADFKNPKLEIAPFSTKKDKLVFLVSAKEDNFQIQIGEITGNKETINLKF